MPSGMCMTTHPLKKAMACACISNTLLPVPLSPMTSLLDTSSGRPSRVLRILSAMSSVSCLTKVAGLRKKPHDCEGLKLSVALRESTTGPGKATTEPLDDSSGSRWPSNSSKSGISGALVLLRTMRLRIAFRSPGLGALPVFSTLFLLSFNVFFPLASAPGFARLTCLGADVERVAVWVVVDSLCELSRARHLRHVAITAQ